MLSFFTVALALVVKGLAVELREGPSFLTAVDVRGRPVVEVGIGLLFLAIGTEADVAGRGGCLAT